MLLACDGFSDGCWWFEEREVTWFVNQQTRTAHPSLGVIRALDPEERRQANNGKEPRERAVAGMVAALNLGAFEGAV